MQVPFDVQGTAFAEASGVAGAIELAQVGDAFYLDDYISFLGEGRRHAAGGDQQGPGGVGHHL
eukprot:11221731-Lingulodinium_polyedra.AAC.1